jgi:hypothetical protein
VVLVFLFAISGCGLAETFNECVLENMKGVGSQAGAFMVRKACRDKVLPHIPARCYELTGLQEAELKEAGKPWFDFAMQKPEVNNCIEKKGCPCECCRHKIWRC